MTQESLQGFQISPQQKHLWLTQQAADRHAYHAKCVIEVEGRLEKKTLESAVGLLLKRHEILRSNFQCLPWMKVPAQVIKRDGLAWGAERDISWAPLHLQEQLIESLFHEAEPPAFDFEQGPLFHLFCARLSTDRHCIYITVPAMLADSMTLENLVVELGRLYVALSDGGESKDEPLQYADVSAVLNDLLVSEETQLGREYWRGQLPQPVSLELPFEKKPDLPEPFSPRLVSAIINSEASAHLQSLAGMHGTVIEVVLLACWAVLMWRSAQAPQMIIGANYDGRTYEGLDEALGLFARYLPIRCELEGGETFARFLMKTAESMAGVSRWQDYFSWEHIFDSAGEGGETGFFPIAYDFEEEPKGYSSHGMSFSILRRYACIDRFKLKLLCAREVESYKDGASL